MLDARTLADKISKYEVKTVNKHLVTDEEKELYRNREGKTDLLDRVHIFSSYLLD